MNEAPEFMFYFNEALAKIPASALWIIFFVFISLSIIVCLALVFHWNKYKLHSPATDMTRTVYLVGLFILIALCGTSLALFSA